jgi:hypothetical protein
VNGIAAPLAASTGRWEITRQALRAARRRLAIWAAAFAGLIALYAVIWPSVRGNTSWRNLFDTLPQTYRALFTARGTIDLSTAGGYLGVELMGFMGPALIAVYAITVGSAAIAGEEDRGGLEVTLSAPVSRVQVFAQRFTALMIGIATLMLATADRSRVCARGGSRDRGGRRHRIRPARPELTARPSWCCSSWCW